MFEDIQKHRQAVAENIEKSFQIGFTESEDLQKAHNVGDVHPNGKWVWTQLPSGKYDWRVIKKTASSSAVPQSSSQKTTPKKNGIELTSKGIKEYINKNSATRDDRMKAMAEVYKALQDSGKNKKVDTFVKEVSSGSPSVDMLTRKYVEAVNDGATHDEAVAFADNCYKEFTTNTQNIQEKVYDDGVSPSTAAKMFASVSDLFKKQKFEKKPSGSGVKKVKPSSNKKSSALIEDTLQKIKQFSYIYWDDKKVSSIKESLEENEKIVRSVMRAAFPSASSGSAINPNTNKVDIDGQDFTFGAYYTINTTSRNPSDRGSKTNHYFVKNDSGKTIASRTSSGRWNTPTDAKNSCKVDVLRILLKL